MAITSISDKPQEKNTSSEKESIYFPQLDGLRFLAFFLVFVHHHEFFKHIPLLTIFNTYGWIGVDLFFALSSFLFTKLLIAEFAKTNTISFKKFYARRIFRIWPIYYLYILAIVIFFIYVQDGQLTSNIKFRLFGLLSFTDNLVSAVNWYNPIPFTAHLWTIAYEEQFYIFIPAIVLFLVRSSLSVKIACLISITTLFSGIRIYLIWNEFPHPAIWMLPVSHFESMVMGIVIGFGGLDFLVKKINPLFLGLLGIAAFALISKLPAIQTISYLLIVSYTLVGVCTTFILLSVLHDDSLKKLFSNKLLVYLGKRSYGLYLYHLFAIHLAGYVAKMPSAPSSLLASFVYSIFITIIICMISYKIIETPFLKLKRKFEIIVTRPI